MRVRVKVDVKVEVKVHVKVTVKVTVKVKGGYFLTRHSVFYTTVNTEGSPSEGLEGDLCRHRMVPHSSDAGPLAA